MEHCEYFESAIHSLYRPLIRCGMGYGAQRWMAHLQKHCDFLNAIMSSTVSGENHSGHSLELSFNVSDKHVCHFILIHVHVQQL